MASRVNKILASPPANAGTHHPRTGAARTTTPETATPGTPPTTAEKLREMDQQSGARGAAGAQRAPAAPPARPANLPAVTATNGGLTAPPAPSTETLARNLAALGSVPLTSIQFDGNEGTYKTPDGPIPSGSVFIAIVPQTRIGFIRFNGAGVPPDIEMRCIAEEGNLLTRDDLPGGYDEVPGPDGQPRVAWQEQIVVPLLSTGEAQDMFSLVARNIVSLVAVRNLLGRFRYHPKSKDGALPIIKLDAGTYLNKKFNTKKPKPVLQLCGWTGPDGKSPTPPAAEKVPFNDEIGI
jgi:hypothetical protein